LSSAPKGEEAIDPPVGEILSLPERVVVAPAMGTFRRLDGAAAGDPIARGDLIGVVQSLRTATPVRSPFGGMLVAFLALEGERVRLGQAVAWLRAT
jgi:biotin carboxyl carrier protein